MNWSLAPGCPALPEATSDATGAALPAVTAFLQVGSTSAARRSLLCSMTVAATPTLMRVWAASAGSDSSCERAQPGASTPALRP